MVAINPFTQTGNLKTCPKCNKEMNPFSISVNDNFLGLSRKLLQECEKCGYKHERNK